jgi:hypothetical protein
VLLAGLGIAGSLLLHISLFQVCREVWSAMSLNYR